MNKILEYKECGLTLEEIELMFFLEKTSKFQDETILQIVQDLFEEKIDGFKDTAFSGFIVACKNIDSVIWLNCVVLKALEVYEPDFSYSDRHIIPRC